MNSTDPGKTGFPDSPLAKRRPSIALPARHPVLTIFLCSLLWALCYPPFPLGPLAFIVLAPAFAATGALSRGGAFRTWFLAGLAYNAIMYWWIAHVMKVGPIVVVGLGVAVLILFLSLFNGILGWAYRAALDSPRRLLLYPLAWAGLEAARAVGEMSFPWNNLGYALGEWPVLFQSVSLWGVYGLSAVMVAANLFLAHFLRTGRPGWLAGFAVIPLFLAAQGALALTGADDSREPVLDIALVQPSIPQTRKWDEAYFAEVMAKTFRTMEGPSEGPAPIEGADLIVLPETAVPDFLRMRNSVAESLQAVAVRGGAPLLVGALDLVRDRRPWSEYRFYNSAFLFPRDPDEGPPRQYSKIRLVPFSEKLPFDGVFPILNYVNLGEGDFSPGDGLRIWSTRGIAWAPSICYEVIYPSFAREARAAGAKLLINITNDGWFGRSNGPYQHANIARFRAAETGMPVARAANNGISAFYDAWGRDLGHTRLMDSTVLRRALPMADRATAYALHGAAVDRFFLLALAAFAAVCAIPGLTAWRARRGRATLSP